MSRERCSGRGRDFDPRQNPVYGPDPEPDNSRRRLHKRKPRFLQAEPRFSRAAGPSSSGRFVIMTALQGRYRLGVRTEDSQSSNTGSIPVSATRPFFPPEIPLTSAMAPSGLAAYFSRIVVERFPGVLCPGGLLGSLLFLDAIHKLLRFAVFVSLAIFLFLFHANNLSPHHAWPQDGILCNLERSCAREKARDGLSREVIRRGSVRRRSGTRKAEEHRIAPMLPGFEHSFSRML